MTSEKIVQEVLEEVKESEGYFVTDDYPIYIEILLKDTINLTLQKARQDFEKMIDNNLTLTEKWEDYTEKDKNAMFTFAMLLKQKLKSEKREI